jgi:hypothetical protein
VTATTADELHWEHGYRCHGYWLGVVRWGVVSIHAHRFGKVPTKDGYGWELTPDGIAHNKPSPKLSGTADTLRQAKRAVEKAYQAWRASH